MISIYGQFHIVNFNKINYFISGYTSETLKTSEELNMVSSSTILISKLLINNSSCYFTSK